MKQRYTLNLKMMHPQFGEMNEVTITEPYDLEKVIFRIQNTFEAWPEVTEFTFIAKVQP